MDPDVRSKLSELTDGNLSAVLSSILLDWTMTCGVERFSAKVQFELFSGLINSGPAYLGACFVSVLKQLEPNFHQCESFSEFKQTLTRSVLGLDDIASIVDKSRIALWKKQRAKFSI